MNVRELLDRVAAGETSPADAAAQLEIDSEVNLEFARVDLSRAGRQGLPEVIFCPGKTPGQIAQVIQALNGAGQNALASRASREVYDQVAAIVPGCVYHEAARAISSDVQPLVEATGLVLVVSAGTSDQDIAAEAALVAQRMGARVELIQDVGVSGLHRLLRHVDRMRAANAVVVVAGMEGALPSVVGGLIDRPVIAVPTSVGYGANLKGIAALLGMLNSCAAGVTVVNIDNGFGAGVAAALINRVAER
jgi:NCAIR mutase (PurE)-related protein